MDGKKGGGKGRGFEKYSGGKGSRPDGGRPRGDRPGGGQSYGDRPRGDRPGGGQSYGDRPRGDRPYGDRPQGASYAGGKHGGKPGDGRRYFDRDARPDGERKPYGFNAKPGDSRPARPYREGPGPRFSKAPERPVPPAVYEDGNRAKPEGPQGDRPRYGRPAPKFDRPGQSGEGAHRYGRPAPKFDRPGQSGEGAPRYGRPAPKFNQPGQLGEGASRYGRPAPKFDRPGQSGEGAPRYGRPAPKFDRPGNFDSHAPRYGRPVPKPEQPDMVSPNADEADAAEADTLLVGRNPIREALKAGQSIEKMLVAQGELSGSAKEIVAKAKDAGIVVQFVDRARLDAIYPNHQGMLAFLSAAAYQTVDDILALAQSKDEAPFIVALDGVTDPHNLGAIIRTAECCGAHGVIIPERRSAGLNPAAVKAAAGALTYLPVAKVGNLSRALAELKEKGLWVVGCDMSGGDIRQSDLTGSVVMVIGSEGEGVSRLVLEGCDRVVSIPLKGQIASLNASVAAGIALYEVMRTRSGQ
jgi:23S rRNA (guanosine2251-2'-O)-methyltransferase